MDWNGIVAANVRRRRAERKLTQEQLAHDAEIDLTYLGGIERGRRNPSVEVLGRIASALGCHPSALLIERE
ncbi:MAG: helix-turn-helix transcriptional regulator [Erythrobacter sp.]|jgi:transcriptional regulator with XRE-family HTH domain|uniref:helix-turn-helix domain-containing protein n=1 Tax=Qipengyuania pacifica TaxID=2860199 RepID=UPI0035C7BC17|nr:helix-turn-helix transcriptional regulator [Erythrobacter sp.]